MQSKQNDKAEQPSTFKPDIPLPWRDRTVTGEPAWTFPAEQEDDFDRLATDPAFARYVRDVAEAHDAEAWLNEHIGPVSAAELAIDQEGRREAVRIVKEAGTKLGDKAVERVLHEKWGPEHEEQFGPTPNPRTVRRWCGIARDGEELPSRPHEPNASLVIERLFKSMQSLDSKARAGGLRRAQRRIPRRPETAEWPKVGEIVTVDGLPKRCLGRTAAGRVAFADLTAPAGHRPAVITRAADEDGGPSRPN